MLNISVIVPVYNTEKWLCDCLNSIVNKDFSEIILIDDGSSDGSRDICDYYKQKYKNVKIRHTANSGLAAARNLGISMASKEWIIFVDSDDYLANDYSEVIGKELDTSYDMILYSGKVMEETKDGLYESDSQAYSRYGKGESFENGLDYLQKCQRENQYIPSSCLAVYKTELVKNIRYPEGVIFEDEYFSIQVSLFSGRVKVIDKSLYYRRMRANSIMTSKQDKKMLIDWCTVSRLIMDFLSGQRDSLIPYCDSMHNHLARNCGLTLFYASRAKHSSEGLSDDDKKRIEENIVNGIECMLAFKDSPKNLSLNQCAVLKAIVSGTQDVIDKKLYVNGYDKYDNEIINRYKELFNKLRLFDPSVKYAIYGVGKHTIGMLDFYVSIFGEIKAGIIFCATKPKEGEIFRGHTVFKISELPEDLDGVVISSFEHRKSMIEELNNNKKQLPIIDFYTECKHDLFSHWNGKGLL